MLRIRCIKSDGERVVAEDILAVVQQVRDVRQGPEGFAERWLFFVEPRQAVML